MAQARTSVSRLRADLPSYSLTVCSGWLGLGPGGSARARAASGHVGSAARSGVIRPKMLVPRAHRERGYWHPSVLALGLGLSSGCSPCPAAHPLESQSCCLGVRGEIKQPPGSVPAASREAGQGGEVATGMVSCGLILALGSDGEKQSQQQFLSDTAEGGSVQMKCPCAMARCSAMPWGDDS